MVVLSSGKLLLSGLLGGVKLCEVIHMKLDSSSELVGHEY